MIGRILRKAYLFSTSWLGGFAIVIFIMFFIGQGFFIPSRSMVGSLYEGDVLVVKKYSYGIPLPRLPWVNSVILPDFFNNGHLIDGPRPKHGDIVVFIPPIQNDNFVKRMFAKNGDEVIFSKDGLYLHLKEGDLSTREFAKNAKTLEFGGKIFVLNPYEEKYPGVHYAYDNRLFYYFASLARDSSNYKTDESGNTTISGISMDPINLNGEIAFYKQIPEDEYFMIGDNRDNSDDSRTWGPVKYANIVGKPLAVIFSISLNNSKETNAPTNPSARFVPRWDRTFKFIENLKVIVPRSEVAQSPL